MSRGLIASKLIASVRNRAFIPDDDMVYSDEDILQVLNEEIDLGLTDLLLGLNEDNLLTYKDYEPQGRDEGYPIPTRAIGNKLKDVMYMSGTNFFPLGRISADELPDYNNSYVFDGIASTDLFYVEGDAIKLVNSSYGQYNRLRMYYHLRPNKIVLERDCAQITAIDRDTGTITVSRVPERLVGTILFDYVQNQTPNKIVDIDVTMTNINTTTRTMVADKIPKNLKIGDWVCVAEESPFLNMPSETHPLLAQRAAVAILESLGDTESLSNGLRKLAQIEKSVRHVLDNRVQGANIKIKPNHFKFKNYNRRRY